MYVFAGCLSATILLLPILANCWELGAIYIDRNLIYNSAGAAFNAILMLLMILGSVLQEEYKDKTFKNIIVSNTSKTKIYIGKYIVQVILGLVLSAICLGVFFIAISLIKKGDGYTQKIATDFLVRFLITIPIYMAGIALGDIFIVLFKQSGVYAIIYYITILFVPKAIDILSFSVSDKIGLIKSYLLTTALNKVEMPYPSINAIRESLVISIIYIVVCLIIGIILINRQEVK
ncbi:Putative Bacitracin ABC transporter permease protein BcrB [Clostridium chauvoei JF4335]|nr:Putative Bacitracin ABC transporter permease protein BcrB [Clostridium chauvoei JF4335]